MMKKKSEVLVWLSVLAVVISAIDSIFKTDILNLAGTQWMLIGIVLAVYALYMKNK